MTYLIFGWNLKCKCLWNSVVLSAPQSFCLLCLFSLQDIRSLLFSLWLLMFPVHACYVSSVVPNALWCFSASINLSSFQLLSHVQLFVTTWTAACQASMSITNSWSPPKHMSIESVMRSSVRFSSCPQSFPASGSFPMSQFFASGAKVLELWFQHQSFQRKPRTNLL